MDTIKVGHNPHCLHDKKKGIQSKRHLNSMIKKLYKKTCIITIDYIISMKFIFYDFFKN